MPDPLVVRVLADYRRQLQDTESAQFRDMAARWSAVQDRLTVQIDSLAAEIDALRQAGEVVSRGRLLRLDRYQALLTQVDAETARFDRLTTGQIVSAQSDAIGLGLEAAGAAINAAYQQAGVSVDDWNRLPRRAVQTMAGLASDGSPLAALIAQSYPLTVQALTDTLVQAEGLGWSPKKTAAAMRQAADLPLNRALRIARTEQLRAYREATREQYAESGVVTAYRRLAAKSLRTCPACLFADGKIYQLDEPLDEHVSGRCQLIPIIDGVSERRWQTGREWFATLPAEQQVQILGPGAYEKWQREWFDLGAFVTRREDDTWGNSLQVTPLGELGKRKPLFPAPNFGKPPTPQVPAVNGPAAGEFKTLKEAKAWAAQNYPNITWDFGGAHIDTINPTLRQFHQLAQDYPDVANRIRYIGTYKAGRPPGYRGKFDGAYAHAYRDGRVIGLNPTWYGKPEKFAAALRADVAAGWHPAGMEGAESVFVHEFGHMVDNWLTSQTNESLTDLVGADGTGLVYEWLGRFKDGNTSDLRSLSRYAVSYRNTHTRDMEAWAEGFAVQYLGDPALHPYTQRQAEFLDVLKSQPRYQNGNWRWLRDGNETERDRARAVWLEIANRIGVTLR